MCTCTDRKCCLVALYISLSMAIGQYMPLTCTCTCTCMYMYKFLLSWLHKLYPLIRTLAGPAASVLIREVSTCQGSRLKFIRDVRVLRNCMTQLCMRTPAHPAPPISRQARSWSKAEGASECTLPEPRRDTDGARLTVCVACVRCAVRNITQRYSIK